jgi:hypothetical protein
LNMLHIPHETSLSAALYSPLRTSTAAAISIATKNFTCQFADLTCCVWPSGRLAALEGAASDDCLRLRA